MKYGGEITKFYVFLQCNVHSPCFLNRCINTNPGFQCLECPDGYTGTYEDALAYNIKHRVFLYRNNERSNYTYQTCDDIDECATNNGGCDAIMTCVNTQVIIDHFLVDTFH